MDQKSSNIEDQQLVNLAEHFAASAKFRDLFSYGMDLVEETATFLDGEGRNAAKDLPEKATSVYGAESMRLTTRLMQLASWLLLQRAVAEGEMTVEQAVTEKKNVKLHQLPTRVGGAGWSDLPPAFLDLIDRSIALQRRIQRLDSEIYSGSPNSDLPEHENPVASQHSLLETAFDPRFKR